MAKCLAAAVLVFCFFFPANRIFAYEYAANIGLGVTEQYNDNILLTQSNKEGDFVTFITPSIDLGIKSLGSSLRVGYSPSFSFYSSHDENNSTSQHLNADGILGISERTTFAVNETYIRSQEITDIVNISNFGPISKLVDRQYNNVSGTLTQNIRNDLTLTAGGSYNIIDYKDPQFNNLTAYSGVLGLAYKPSDRMTLALNAVYTVYDFSQNSESTTQQYTLGIQYKLLPTLTMGMTGGAVITEIKDSGGSDIGFAGGIDLTQTFEKGSATVYFKQSVVPDTENGEPVTAQTVGGGISRPFSEKSTSFVSASYTKYKSAVSGGGVNQDSIYVNGGLDYKVAKWADLSLAYSYIKSNDKEINPRNYVNNIIALTLKVHYGKEPQSWSQTKEALR